MSFLGWTKRYFSKFGKEDRNVNNYCEIEPIKFLKELEPCSWGGNEIEKVTLREPYCRNAFDLFPCAVQKVIILAKKPHIQNGVQWWPQGQKVDAGRPERKPQDAREA